MKTAIKIETLDGELHNNEKDAQRHLDKLLADEMGKHAHALVHKMKYSAICEYLEENLKSFTKAAHIQDDFNLINDLEQ